LGCKAVKNFSLSPVVPISFNSPDLDDPKCHNDCNGSITVLPIGGSMPYTYSWTPSGTVTATSNALCAGSYSVVVTDIKGCAATSTFALVNPASFTLTANVQDATCNTALDGAITTTVIGAAAPYVPFWVPGNVANQNLTNVLSGTYTLTITDNVGCSKDSVFIINSTVTVHAIAGRDTIFCQNGTLLLDGVNSTGANIFQWQQIPVGTVISNSISTTVVPAVGSNTYVLVASSGVCVDKDSIVVVALPLPNVDAGTTLSIPIFSSAQIGGNPTGPNGSTFAWTPVTGLDNPTGTNPVSGTTVTTNYTVTVVDGNGCVNFDTVTVFIYPAVSIPNGFSPNADGKMIYGKLILSINSQIVKWKFIIDGASNYFIQKDMQFRLMDNIKEKICQWERIII